MEETLNKFKFNKEWLREIRLMNSYKIKGGKLTDL